MQIDFIVTIMIVTNIVSILVGCGGIIKFVSRFAIMESKVNDLWNHFVEDKDGYTIGKPFKNIK